MPSYTKVASGNIGPARFVKYDTTADDKVLQAGTGDKIYGVSGPDVHLFPGDLGLDDGFHAVAGQNCLVFGNPEMNIMLQLGGTVTRGDRLKSDTNGKGVTTTSTGDEIGAEAQVSGVLDQVIPVRLISPSQY